MFTGIIREVGTIKKISRKKGNIIFLIESKKLLKTRKIGDSIAVDGVCLTIINIKKNLFETEAIPETLKRTTLSIRKTNDKVNLELPITEKEALEGHIVQGHVDDTGTVEDKKNEGNSKILKIQFPQHLKKYIALKGSIAINGVSLTISDLTKNTFNVSLIPHTLKNTNLGLLKKGNKVNLEVDILARYGQKPKPITAKKIAIVFSKFHDEVGGILLKNTTHELTKLGIKKEDIKVFHVPGALEIPFACQKLVKSDKYKAIITLGVVIKGETAHFDHVSQESIRGVMNISLKYDIPIITGILTTYTEEQARIRANVKGKEFAMSAIEMTKHY